MSFWNEENIKGLNVPKWPPMFIACQSGYIVFSKMFYVHLFYRLD